MGNLLVEGSIYKPWNRFPSGDCAAANSGNGGNGGGDEEEEEEEEEECVSKTCFDLNKGCGLWSNGCEGEISCGFCNFPQSCSDGVCVDSSQDCVLLNGSCKTGSCSSWSPSCSDLSSGTCSSGNSCCAGNCNIVIGPGPGPGPGPTPGPGTGTLADPYKMNHLGDEGGFVMAGKNTADFSISGNKKVYFEVDPYGYINRSFDSITMMIKGFTNSGFLKFYYSVADKTTGNTLIPMKRIYLNNSLGHIQNENNLDWDLDNVKYIYGVENFGSGTATTQVYWTW